MTAGMAGPGAGAAATPALSTSALRWSWASPVAVKATGCFRVELHFGCLPGAFLEGCVCCRGGRRLSTWLPSSVAVRVPTGCFALLSSAAFAEATGLPRSGAICVAQLPATHYHVCCCPTCSHNPPSLALPLRPLCKRWVYIKNNKERTLGRGF